MGYIDAWLRGVATTAA